MTKAQEKVIFNLTLAFAALEEAGSMVKSADDDTASDIFKYACLVSRAQMVLENKFNNSNLHIPDIVDDEENLDNVVPLFR